MTYVKGDRIQCSGFANRKANGTYVVQEVTKTSIVIRSPGFWGWVVYQWRRFTNTTLRIRK